MRRWNGAQPRRASFAIGFGHGIFCVGCCWALMLLMFAVSAASLAWMLFLALIMTVEKNAPWGREIVKPFGCVLIGVGAVLLIYAAG